MAVGSIRMNLDFALNTSEAIKSAARLQGGMTHLIQVSAALTKHGEILNADLASTFNDVFEHVINTTDVMGLLEKHVDSAFNGIYSNKLKSALDDIYTSQLNVISSMQGINAENARFGAVQAVVESLSRSTNAAKAFAETFNNVGLSVKDGTENIIAQLTKLHSTNEKAFTKLTKVMERADELSSGLNPKQLTQYRQHMSQLSDAFSKGEINADDFAKSQDRLNYRFEVMNEKLPRLKEQIGGLFSGVRGQIIGVLGAMAIIDDAFSSQQQTVETTHRLALRNIQMFEGQSKSAASFGKTVRDMNAAIRTVGGQTQISMTKASEALNSLAEARIPGTIEDLTNLTITSVRMSQAFGISEGQAADLFKTLSLAGNLSPQGINEVAEALADVQAVWGLTGAEATEAAAQVGHVINRMSRMGSASIKNAKIVAREVGRMTTAFTRAGLSANEASQMMDRFMDPSKIEDNAYLWHTMGLTVSQGLAMMTGDASSMEGMTEKMMKSAVNLKKEYGNNPLALSAMAEAMGMTVQMVNQLASEYEREANMTSDMRKELERQATLESQAAQARESAAQALQKLAAIGNVFMQTFVMPLLDLITPLITGLGKGLSFINGFLDKLGAFGQVAKGAMGALLLFTMVTGINLIKLSSSVNGLGGAFSGLLGKVKDLAISGVKAIGTFVAKSAKSLLGTGPLGKAIEGIGDKMSKIGAEKVGPSKDLANKIKPEPKSSKFMEGMAKLPAKNLMMVGAAIFLVAGAVFLLSLSLKTLVDVIQNATAGEIFGALGIMAVIIVGLGLAVFAASKLFIASAPGLLFFGGAMLMVAGAVSIMVLSLSVLMNTIKDMDPGKIVIGIIALAVALGGLIGMAAVMAPMAMTAGVGLLFLGGALLMIAGAVSIMVLSVALLLNMIKNMDPTQIASGVNILAVALGGLAVSAIILGIASKIAGPGLLFLGGALLMIAGAASIMALSVVLLLNTINNMNFTGIGENLKVLIYALGGLAAAAIILGVAGKFAGPGLLFLGGALLMIAGAALIMALSFSTLMNTIKNMDPTQIASSVGVLAVALGGLAAIAIILGLAGKIAGPGLITFSGALLMIATAASIMVLSVALLLNTISSMNPDQIASGINVLAGALGGLIIVALALAVISKIAGTGLLIFGGALLMIAGAASIMVLSVALLLNTIKDMNPGQIASGIGVLAVALSGLILMAMVLAPAATIAGTGLLSFGAALLMVGGAVALIGAGFLLMSIAIKSLVESVNNLGPAFASNANAIAAGASAISWPLMDLAIAATLAFIPLALLGVAFVALGAGAMAVGAGLKLVAEAFNSFIEMGNELIPISLKIMGSMLLLSVGLLAVAGVGYLFGFAILGLLAIIPGLLLLGLAMNTVSNNFMNMGNGVKLFADNIGIVLTGIDQLKQKLSGVSGMSNTFVEEIGKMTEALADLKSFAGAGMINSMITMLMKPAKGSADKDNASDNAMMEKMDVIVGHLNDISSYTLRTATAVEGMEKKLNSGSGFNSQPNVNLA